MNEPSEILQFPCLFMDSIINPHKYSTICKSVSGVKFYKSSAIFGFLNGKSVFFPLFAFWISWIFFIASFSFSLLLVLTLIQEWWYCFPCIFGVWLMALILHNYLLCRPHNHALCLLVVLQNNQCYCHCCLTLSYKLA